MQHAVECWRQQVLWLFLRKAAANILQCLDRHCNSSKQCNARFMLICQCVCAQSIIYNAIMPANSFDITFFQVLIMCESIISSIAKYSKQLLNDLLMRFGNLALNLAFFSKLQKATHSLFT